MMSDAASPRTRPAAGPDPEQAPAGGRPTALPRGTRVVTTGEEILRELVSILR